MLRSHFFNSLFTERQHYLIHMIATICLQAQRFSLVILYHHTHVLFEQAERLGASNSTVLRELATCFMAADKMQVTWATRVREKVERDREGVDSWLN